jgi:hypothetical protein
MSHRITTRVEIAAPPEMVWGHLTDLDSFEQWNPFMIDASGRVEEGAKLHIRMQQPGGSAMTFKPTVTRSEGPYRFEWLGSLVVRGLFDGRHQFELEPTDSGTLLRHSEEFTGVLVPVLKKSLDTKTLAGFEAMNRALRSRVEAAVREST